MSPVQGSEPPTSRVPQTSPHPSHYPSSYIYLGAALRSVRPCHLSADPPAPRPRLVVGPPSAQDLYSTPLPHSDGSPSSTFLQLQWSLCSLATPPSRPSPRNLPSSAVFTRFTSPTTSSLPRSPPLRGLLLNTSCPFLDVWTNSNEVTTDRVLGCEEPCDPE